jgi:hypothetical protein
MFTDKDAKPDEIVVFQILPDSQCSECAEALGKGRLLRLEDERPLCLACADLSHLVFVPSGNAALTRRAGRYSTLKAVVVGFSRSRNRYERRRAPNQTGFERVTSRELDTSSSSIVSGVSPSIHMRRIGPNTVCSSPLVHVGR